MKKWLLGLVLLVSVGAIAQPANYIHDRVRKRMPAGMFDSTLHVPRFNGSPSLRTGGSTNDGAIAIDTANGVFYFYHNSSWKRANIDTSNAFITSVYRKAASDSVFYVKGGTHTFAFKDSIGGGATPTLQQVLETESNSAVIGNTNIDPSAIGLDLSFGDVGVNIWNDIVLKGDGVISIDAQTVSSSKFSSISANPDSITLNAHLGRLNIDSLRSWSGISDTTYKKVMTWDTRNGRWEYSNWFGGGGGGGGSPAGNYGNVQVNRNGAFATPASDSLDFDSGLNIIGNLNASKFTWTGNSLYPYLALSGNDPLIYFGGTGAAYPSFGKSGGSAVIYGSSGTQSIGFYDQLIGGKQMLRLYSNGGGSAAVFNKTVISVDTVIGGPSDGSIMAIASRGDSTSMATGLSTHMFRGINSQYSNTNAANTFYGTVIYSNTNSSATGDHIVNWQSDAKKTGASTLDIIYHSAYLGDSIIAGTVNKRYGIKYWDAIVNGGAVLGSQMFIKVEKLKAATSNFDFLSDSAQTAKLDGNILLGDSTVAASARKTIHFFNGTAPSANISGAILYAESGELKVRDSGGNIVILTAGTSSNSVVTNSGTQTLTNKRITKRVGTTASTASLTIDSDSYDMYTVTALAANITINNPSGTPTSGQTLIIRLEDNGTGRTISYGADFRAIGVTLPTTTVSGKTIYLGCIWNSTDSKWDVVSVNEEA